MKNTYERFIEEICSNCKDKEKKDCEIREKIDGTLYCEIYERKNKSTKKKKQYIGITAKQLKPIMRRLM